MHNSTLRVSFSFLQLHRRREISGNFQRQLHASGVSNGWPRSPDDGDGHSEARALTYTFDKKYERI